MLCLVEAKIIHFVKCAGAVKIEGIMKMFYFILIQITIVQGIFPLQIKTFKYDVIKNTTNLTDRIDVNSPTSTSIHLMNTTVANELGQNSSTANNKINEFESTGVVLEMNDFQESTNVTTTSTTPYPDYSLYGTTKKWTSTTTVSSTKSRTDDTVVKNKYPLIGPIIGTTAIGAGLCLIFAIIGYFGCVGYKSYIDKKYGSSQMVEPEDTYDTADLKYFEI